MSPTVVWRRLFAEWLGSGLLAAVVIGSGIAAQRLSPGQVGLELLENAAVTASGLYALILMFGPVSGAHFNPLISVAAAVYGGIPWKLAGMYLPAQVGGCVSGALLANVMFGRAASAPAAVGAYIGAAYWFTSSTSFANPAITVGRIFSNSFAGIAPSSVPGFIGAQILGGVIGYGLIKALYPSITAHDAEAVVLPQTPGRLDRPHLAQGEMP